MTKAKAEALREKWKQQANPPACEHLIQEEVVNADGKSTGYYVCNLCGQSVEQSDLAA
jgi:transcription elongation factor Elf1